MSMAIMVLLLMMVWLSSGGVRSTGSESLPEKSTFMVVLLTFVALSPLLPVPQPNQSETKTLCVEVCRCLAQPSPTRTWTKAAADSCAAENIIVRIATMSVMTL